MGEDYFTSPGVLDAAGLPVAGLWLLRQGWLMPSTQLQGVLCSQQFMWPPVIPHQPPGLFSCAGLD